MINIDVGNLRVGRDKLLALRKTVISSADDIYRRKLRYLGELALYVSPQFSGDFVSNWHFLVDGKAPPLYRPGGRDPDVVVHEDERGRHSYTQSPKQAGDMEFIRPGLSRLIGQLRGVTVKSQVRLVNVSELETDGVRMMGPVGPGDVEVLRTENIIPGRVRIEQYLKARVKDLPTSRAKE